MYETVESDPEHFGLTIIGRLDDPRACYSFDTLVVWQDGAGRVLYASDSGCSCPSPFEGMGVNDLYVVTPNTWDEFAAAVNAHCAPEVWDHDYPNDPLAGERVELLAAVSALVGH